MRTIKKGPGTRNSPGWTELGADPVDMIEIMRTNDLVLLSAVDALLTGADIEFFIADQHMSSLEGSVGFLPRRLLVPADRVHRARRLLRDAGLEQNLLDDR